MKRAFKIPHRGIIYIIASVALTACDAEVQKSNYRTSTISNTSATPSESVAAAQGSATSSPSAEPSISTSSIASESPTVNPSPSSTSPTPTPSPSMPPSPNASPSPLTGNTDSTPPTPGQSGALEASSVTSSNVTISWTVALDNKTPRAQLQYLAYVSTANNLDTIAATEANGTPLGNYVSDVNEKIFFGLNSSTTYFFNVIVKDIAGNKSLYTTVSETTSDVTAPTPGNSGNISAANITAASLNLSWTLAADDVSSASTLEYLAVRSTSNNLSTVTDAEINGTAIGAYTANLTILAVTGLVSSRTYYFNVIVKDAAGNKSIYTTQTASTLDVTAPLVGSSGTITASNKTTTSMALAWTKGSDNISVQTNLQYLVYKSLSNNIPSLSGAEANGTAIGTYTTDINSKAITGLTVNTTYYFTVVVRDESGNKAAYTMITIATLPLAPTFPGRTEAYAKISTAWTYPLSAVNGLAPLVYSLVTAPTGASINSSSGLISYTTGGSPSTQSFSVKVVDAASREATQNFFLEVAADKKCVWTGLSSVDFATAGNWIFCNSAVPGNTDYVVIDAAAAFQPFISVSTVVKGIGAATSGAGGTITVKAGADFRLVNVGDIKSDLVVKGETPTCTTCLFSTYYGNYAIYILNGATLTLGSGINMSICSVNAGENNRVYVGSSTESGHFVAAPNSSNPAEWPTLNANPCGPFLGGIVVEGPSGDPSSISFDGLKIHASEGITEPLVLKYNVVVDKFRNVNFSVDSKNGIAGPLGGPTYSGDHSYIQVYTCASLTVNDPVWSGLTFSQGTRDTIVGFHTYAVNIGCSGFGPITISGSGLAYGLETDPGNVVNWTNSSSSTCTWTGAVDTAWTTPGNWSNCTNGRSNYPDQLDWTIIPAGPSNQPLVTGNQAMQGTAVATGGGTITVSANSSLYIAAQSSTADNIASSVKFAGAVAGCTTCAVQPRSSLYLGDGVTLELLPNIRIAMASKTQIYVGESTGRTSRAASLIASGGATAANFPAITGDLLLGTRAQWQGIVLDGKTGTNSTLSIDGLVVSDVSSATGCGASAFAFNDRYTVSKLDHLSIGASGSASSCGNSIQVNSCANSSIVSTWTDMTFPIDSTGLYNIGISAASCSAISPITITGQGIGYGSSFANDPNSRLNWQ